MNHPILQFENVTFSFNAFPLLSEVSLEVRPGEVLALLGRNGCGKSTLLRMAMGRIPVGAGSVRVFGLVPGPESATLRQKIGYSAPDRLEAPAWMSGLDYLHSICNYYPTWNRTLQDSLAESLHVDLKQSIAHMSKGARAKLCLLAALAHEPALLLLDEPFSGLDAAVRREVFSTLIDTLATRGPGILLVSHSAGDVERLADRIAIIEGGHIRRMDPMDKALAGRRDDTEAGEGADGAQILSRTLDELLIHTFAKSK